MWSYLKVCKKFHFVVDKKQNVLVLKPKKEEGESGDRNVGTLKAISYNYDECRQSLAKMVIIDELPFNFSFLFHCYERLFETLC
jgi:hypothetical protein